MKTLLLALALLISSHQAHAFMSATQQTMETRKASSNTSFLLDTFKIDRDSNYLPQEDRIRAARIDINQMAKTLTLTVYPKFDCPALRCPMIMPAPVQITLPVVYMGSPYCGGRIFRAERNSLPVDGDYLEIQVIDNSGKICHEDANDNNNRTEVTIVEKTPRGDRNIVSEMSGFREIN